MYCYIDSKKLVHIFSDLIIWRLVKLFVYTVAFNKCPEVLTSFYGRVFTWINAIFCQFRDTACNTNESNIVK